MKTRRNYYDGLAADYSRPEPVPDDVGNKLIAAAESYIARKEPELPAIGPDYPLEQIEAENKDMVAHALRGPAARPRRPAHRGVSRRPGVFLPGRSRTTA